MDIIKTLFWNGEERRLRLLWRLIIFGLVFAPLAAGMQTLIFFLAPPLVEALERGTGPQLIMGMAVSEWLMIGAILVTLLIIARWVDRRPFSDYGFHLGGHWWLDLAFGLFLGALLMTGIFLIEYLMGWVTVSGTLHTPEGTTFAQAILWSAVLFIGVGFFEELLSRGYLLHNLAEGLNFQFWSPTIALILAWAISSALFGAAHIGNPNATTISTINIAVAGLFLVLGYILTGDLALPIGVHITWNFFQGNVFGFPVSGTPTNQVSFIAIEQGGPDLWTGGSFGPEAGVIGLLAMAVGAILIIGWVKWRYGRLQLQLSIPLPPEQSQT
jgi:membrane protease YdiL (CAAX protease family)